MDKEFYDKLSKELCEVILENLGLSVVLTDKDNKPIYKNTDETDYSSFSKKNIKIKDKEYQLLTQNDTNKTQEEFINTVSHELRTPLTSIRGFADTMLNSSDMLTKEQQNKFLTIIKNQADRLTRLVENLLEVSNITRKATPILKEINFKNFISPIITIFERKYPNTHFETIIFNKLPEIWADSDILEQIMTNLIDNAAKYSQENAKVIIKAEFLDNNISIKIIDEAVKIPTNQLENIFNKFSRIDNPLTRKVEGSGLGLYITKTLVTKLNGTIKAENHENGNIFTVILPVTTVEKQMKSKIRGEKN